MEIWLYLGKILCKLCSFSVFTCLKIIVWKHDGLLFQILASILCEV